MEEKQTSVTPTVKKPMATAPKANKQSQQYQRDKDRQPVKGIFHFYEVPGGTMTFRFKKYKGDHALRYSLKDGEVCTVPLGVAKHLNSAGKYPIHSHAVDANGANIFKIGEKKRRFGFQSLEFIDPADFSTVDSNIVTVEKV